MAVYMLHYASPLSGLRNRHYLGFADGDVERRIRQHRKGKAGAVFTTEAHRQGIAFVVANVWPELTKDDERRIKQSKNHARYCRVCSGREWPMPRPHRAVHARKLTLGGSTGEKTTETGQGSDTRNGTPYGDPVTENASCTDGTNEGDMLNANLIGNIGGDPELRYTPNGQPVLTFNVAHNFNEKVGEEWEQRVEWVRCVVFGDRSEKLGELLKKGQRVYVYGQLKARPWVDREDNMRAGLEIIARDVEFAGERQEGNGQTYNPKPSGQPTNRQSAAGAKSARDLSKTPDESLPF